MTEAEWLVSEDPKAMAEFLRTNPRGSPRVWRLFMCAFWITQLPFITGKRDRASFLRRMDQLEKWAETGKGPKRSYTNVFMSPDVTNAWERTIGCASQTHGGFITAK